MLLLNPGHGSKEDDQDADGDKGERCAREKLRRPIETLPASRLHERDQRQNETDRVTTERDRRRGFRRPTSGGRRKRTDQFTEPKK